MFNALSIINLYRMIKKTQPLSMDLLSFKKNEKYLHTAAVELIISCYPPPLSVCANPLLTTHVCC